MGGNPFRPAEAVVPRVKCLVYGQSGVGKTYLALTAPGKVAVIDTEGGTAFYAGRSGLSAFDVLPTKTFNDVTRAIAYLAAHPGEYETLVIDPVTVLYETLQDAAQSKRAEKRHNSEADLEMLDWQRIKRAYKALMTDLVNLPMHVIVTAREKDDEEGSGDNRRKVGTKPDAEKNTPYYFDTVVRLVARGQERKAEVTKDRTGTIPAEVAAPTFAKLFNKAMKAGKDATLERQVASDAEAAERDGETTFGEGQNLALPATPDGGLIGVVSVQGTQDFELRLTPDGYVLPFRVKSGRAGIIVTAEGQLAEQLAALRAVVIGQRVTVWGEFKDETFTKGDASITYTILHLSRIQTPDVTLPQPDAVPEPADPPEAPTAPIFDDSELAAIDAALDKVPA